MGTGIDVGLGAAEVEDGGGNSSGGNSSGGNSSDDSAVLADGFDFEANAR